MKALFLGSIGVIAETSEIQRQAFNAAFKKHGLDWYWSVANYCEMLKNPGGIKRLASFSNSNLALEELKHIHLSKEEYFSQYLREGILPRAGVVECISKCKERGIKICFITTTTENNINILSSALSNNIDFNVFDMITTKADVVAEKPSGEVYRYALDKFALAPHDVIAVEDTEANQAAALQEDILCYLFAGEYASTQHNLNSINSLTVIASQL